MNAASNPTGVGQAGPSLPAQEPAPAAAAPAEGAADTPFLPAAKPVVPTPIVEPAEFDAKAMVEAQKHSNANPAYGALPQATPESIEAAQALRAQAARKRKRNKLVSRSIALVMLVGVAAAGWFGYQAYQDSNDQIEADREAAQADGSAGAPGALTPLGNQQDVIDAIGDVNSGASASAGGLVGAIDDAREAVGGVNDDATAVDPPPSPSTVNVESVLPEIVRTTGERLPDLTGRETYVVRSGDFSAGDPAAFAEFVKLFSAKPQMSPDAAVFADFPAVNPDEIIISVERAGDQLLRAIVVSTSPNLHVDYIP